MMREDKNKIIFKLVIQIIYLIGPDNKELGKIFIYLLNFLN